MNYFVGGIWKSLDLWAREAQDCCKQSLMNHSGGSMKNQKADWQAVNTVLIAIEGTLENWATDHSCYIMTKNLKAYCSCFTSLSKNK